MSCHLSPKIVTSGLVFSIDARNPKSYSGSGNTWAGLVKGYNVTLNAGGTAPTYSNGTFQYRNSATMFSSATFDEGVLRGWNEAGSWSIEAYFKHVSATSTNECIVAGRSGCHGGIYINSNNVLVHAVKTSEASCWTGALSTAVTTMVPGETYHTVFTYSNGVCTHYVNGTPGDYPTTTFDVTTYNMSGYDSTFLIGGVSGRMPNVDIAVVRCYNRALSEEEIKKNYVSLKSRVL